MPPKRKKSVRQKQKQRQSQSQRVNITIGSTPKSTPRKRKTSGRGRLPPPSYQQNLFPPTIIQQQAPSLGNLETQISRLTSLIQPTQPIQNLNTPLNTNVRASSVAPSQQDIRDYEARLRAGEEAEKRRPGPTAENFQAQPSKADFGFPDPLTGGISDISTLTGPSLPVGFNEDESAQAKEALDFIKGLPDDDETAETTKADESVSEPSERFEAEIQKQKKEKDFGGSSMKPSNTIKPDDATLKKSPPQSKLAEELPQDFTPITRQELAMLRELSKPGRGTTEEEEKTKKRLHDLARKSGRTTPKRAPTLPFPDDPRKVKKEPKPKKASDSSEEETEKQKVSMRMARASSDEDFGRD